MRPQAPVALEFGRMTVHARRYIGAYMNKIGQTFGIGVLFEQYLLWNTLFKLKA
jgi:hypothetical protein